MEEWKDEERLTVGVKAGKKCLSLERREKGTKACGPIKTDSGVALFHYRVPQMKSRVWDPIPSSSHGCGSCTCNSTL